MNAKMIMLAIAVAVIGSGALMLCDDSEAAAGDVLASGSCGTSLTYEVRSLNADDSQAELVISGSGAMTSGTDTASTPWLSSRPIIISVSLPDGIQNIGGYAFYQCKALTSVTIPDTVTTIETYAFSGCSALTSVTIPNSITSINDWAFSSCSALTSVTIPDTVTTIGNYIFYGCKALTSLPLPANVTSINEGMFNGCSALTSVTIPDTVTTIGNSAFSGCSALKNLYIGKSVANIAKYAFRNCSNLEEIEFNAINCSAFSADSHIFENAGSETNGVSVVFGEMAETIPTNMFYNTANSKISSVNTGNTVTTIGNSAFSGCTTLTSLNLGNSVTSIGGSAFNGCSALTSVTIPDTVTTIGNGSFGNCTMLIDLTMPIVSTTNNIGPQYLETLTYTTTGDWPLNFRTDSVQYHSRDTLQSITFATDYIPANAIYGQNLSTLTINGGGDPILGYYISPTTRATTEDLTVTGTAAYIVRLTDLYGNAELLDGGITTNDVTIGWNTAPDGYGTGPVDASPEVLVYPAKIGNKSPYSGLFDAIPLIVIVAIITTIIGMIAFRRD